MNCFNKYFCIVISVFILLVALFFGLRANSVPVLDSLNTYTPTTQTVSTDESIVFSINRAASGESITHEIDSPNIFFNETGRYVISFNATVTIDALPVDSIIAYLTLNDVKIDGSEVYSSPLFLLETNSFAATVIIETSPGDVLNLANTSTTDAIYRNANVSIVKIS